MEGEMKMEGMDLFSEYNYDYLRSPVKTNYSADAPVKNPVEPDGKYSAISEYEWCSSS
jgi:hypothetical protein